MEEDRRVGGVASNTGGTANTDGKQRLVQRTFVGDGSYRVERRQARQR